MMHGWRFLLIPLICTISLASFLMARTVIVTMTNGTRIKGELIEDTPDAVVVESHGIRSTIQRGDIQSMEDEVPFEQELADRRAKLAEGDVKARLDLARWCLGQHQYDAARALTQEVSKIDPNNAEAVELEDYIRRQVAMEQRSATRPPTPTEPRSISSTPASVERNFISEPDINLIKNVELAEGEKIAPRFLNNVAERYLEQYGEKDGMDAKSFRKLSPMQQFYKIRDTKDPALMRDLSIVGDPVRVSTYRKQVQPIMLSGCTSSGCHGTMEGKGFVVFVNPTSSDGATYSNYYILMHYTRMMQTDGTGLFDTGKIERKMIDRQNPENSLLLQYGLPRTSAIFKHPQVNGQTPIFRDKNDPKYKTVLAWIKSLGPIDPVYRVDFVPPRGVGESSATQPAATGPATAPGSATPSEPAPLPNP